jgi:hypothetical protein
MKEIENFKEAILKEYPRLSLDSEFSFRCHPGVPCFNGCCRDVNIFLTPYDILRLKKQLGITSGQFLSEYTLSPFDENLKYPVVLLKMRDDAEKTCPFVGPKGCEVYEDRPWACRMYPLGKASPDTRNEVRKDFFFLLKEDVCKGFEQEREWTIRQWLEDQGIDEYDSMGQQFKALTLHPFFQEGKNLTPQKTEMFFMACYHLDKFREFLFESSFFDKFDVDRETCATLKTDDLELLKFGHDWLRFLIFGENTISIKSHIVEVEKKKLAESGNNPVLS